MKKQIAGTELYTSPAAFGGDVAGRVCEEDFYLLLDRYTELGGNHIDTAALYGNGESERRIGHWLKTRHRENDVFVATKGAFPAGNNLEKSRIADVESDLDESLRRLGVDCIDLYYLHRDDLLCEPEKIMDIMLALVKKGKIRYLGCSNWRGERIERANKHASKCGQAGFAVSQIKWSAAVTAFEADGTLVEMDEREYAFYKKHDLTVTAFSPQAKGYFTKLFSGAELSEKARARYGCPENIKRYERARILAQDKSIGITAVILGYLWGADFHTVPVIGCSSLSQLNDSMDGAGIPLTKQERRFLEEGE